MRDFLIFVLLFHNILFFSCKSEINLNDKDAFLGGQIVNPSSNYVTLYKNNISIDCLLLDSNNSFEIELSDIKSGIYKVEHIPEYQSIIIESGDSLWMRANSSDFNKSIFFSGIGSSKNNFLMDMKLKIDEESQFLSSKYSLNSDDFSNIIDSLLIQKKKSWIKMDSINNLTKIAQKITMASYVYPYATIRERYSLLRGTNWASNKDSIYFNYRRFLNFEEKDLAFFEPYINYVINFLNEKSLDSSMYYFKHKNNTNFNIKRLQTLENEISGRELKNNLARAIAYDEIFNFKNHLDHENFLQYYFAINTNTMFLAEILNLHNDIKKMSKGFYLPEINLQNSNLDSVSSNSIFNNKKTLIYFWSQTQMNHYGKTIKILNKIKKIKPEYQYVGISLQPLNQLAIDVNKMMKQEIENQYAIIDFEEASKKWIISLINKAIILDSKGRIVNGFANFFDPSIINQL